MAEIFLIYTDESGEKKRVTVDRDRVVVGRHSGTDVCIRDGRLSREHLKIERFGDIFVASDAGSSNGTRLNDAALTSPAALKEGDVLDLGGVLVTVSTHSNNDSDDQAAPAPAGDESQLSDVSGNGGPDVPEGEVAASLPDDQIAPPPLATSSSNSWVLLLMIPIFALIVVLFAGGVIYLLVSGGNTTVAQHQNDFIYSSNIDNENDNKTSSNKSDGGNTTNGTGPSSNNIPTSSDTPSNSNTTPPPGKLGDTAKIEQNGAAFMRRIAQNDPRAFLTSEQAQRVSPKVKQLSGSSALAENLNSARRNASQIKSIAQSKNLKPQFLAIAAVAKLGTARGDVVQTAQGMADILDKLSVQIGSEFGEDSLLIVAAYGQGSSGEFMKMRNMLQELANKFPESTRAIRTIWFLQKNGKITQSEFDAALNFLAIGTISQNPKDFGVNAEALAL